MAAKGGAMSTSLTTGNVLPPLGTNKGTVLSAGGYLRVGDYLFTGTNQPYGYYAVLQANGDLRFYYSVPGEPAPGDTSHIDHYQPDASHPYYSLLGAAAPGPPHPACPSNPAQPTPQPSP